MRVHAYKQLKEDVQDQHYDLKQKKKKKKERRKGREGEKENIMQLICQLKKKWLN